MTLQLGRARITLAQLRGIARAGEALVTGGAFARHAATLLPSFSD